MNRKPPLEFNPLECKVNYSATSNNIKLVHWPLMGRQAVTFTFGTARRGLSGPQSVWKIWYILCVCVSRPVTLKLVRNVARVMGYSPAHFGDTTTIRFRFMGHWANTAQTDHVTLRP